jgi:hypothetical protein
MLSLPALAIPDVIARAAIVEGYNTNTYQAQDEPNVPTIERHPSPFTGLDGSLELRWLGRDADRTTLVLGGRYNHYEPIQAENQSDDGSFSGLLTSHLTLSPKTTLSVSESGSVTSFNAAHVTDGTIFAFDPTQVRSTYWIDDANVSLMHQLAPNWRFSPSIGAMISGTLRSAPTELPDGQFIEHRGLDYVTPYIEADVTHDFTPRAAGDVMALYQYALEFYVLDLTQTPPKNIGPQKATFVTMLAGYTYHFTQELTTVLHGGAVLASAPPLDPDPRAILSPAGSGEVYYTRPFFDLVAAAGYTWGTINPRLGAGPTATASVVAVGVPYPVGNWQNLALIGRAQASYSSLITGVGQSTTLGLYAAGVEVRYGLNGWLGVLAGYDGRYATFETPTFTPPFIQHVFFLGLSGYWATDRVQLPLTTFAAPVQPPA